MKNMIYPLSIMALAASMWVGCAKNSDSSGGGGGGGGNNSSLYQVAVVCAQTAVTRGFGEDGIIEACANVKNAQCPSLAEYRDNYEMYERRWIPELEEAAYCDGYDERSCFLTEFTTINTFWTTFIHNSYMCTPADRQAMLVTLRNRVNGLATQTYRPSGYSNQYGAGGYPYGGTPYGGGYGNTYRPYAGW